MILKNKKENIIAKVRKKDRVARYLQFAFGIILVAVAFNVLILPNNIVYGVSGISVILKTAIGTDPATVILIGSIILLIMSYFLLGIEKTKNSVVGSLLFPVLVKLTETFPQYITIADPDPLLLTIFGAVISGFGYGLIFKSGFTTGGTDILNQIVSKYFKISIGNSMFFTDGLIILSGAFVFNWTKVMYSIISLYLISVMTDKVILGISQSKCFYIVTNHETAVKKFLIDYLSHGVTVLDGRGGFTGNHQKVIMCIVPTREYFVVKEGIHAIDENAFFLVTDAYEVSGGE